MKRTIFSCWWLAGVMALLLCCASSAFAGSTQFALETTTGQLYGEYTSPYGTDTAGGVICDDFIDTAYIGQEYTYNQQSANSIIAGTSQGIWGSGMEYAEAAYLALQVYSSTGLTQELYNWALWSLFDPTAALGTLNGNHISSSDCDTLFGSGAYSGGTCSYGTGGMIGAAIANGWADYLAGAFSNLVVYTPLTNGGQEWCNSPGSCQSQEFFGLVPEGGTAFLYLLLAGFTCFGAMFYSRRQTGMGSLA